MLLKNTTTAFISSPLYNIRAIIRMRQKHNFALKCNPAPKLAKHQKYKKQPIPKQYKHLSWTKYIGESVSSLCPCCQINKISVWDCEYGHIIAEKKGGITAPNNLIPVCRTCNSQMGTTDMREYSKKKFNKENTVLTNISTRELYKYPEEIAA